jgi:RNA polymerase sigma-70 factor (ECF subfamily)
MLRRDPLANPEPLIRRVYAYVAYRLGDGADAEDVTSAAFERALRYRDSFDSARGEPAAWLIGIARREIAEHFAGALPADRDVPDVAGPSDLAVDTALSLDLRAAVATLDDRDRELIALRYGADLSARQIGELLELKTNAVEVALHRALGRLRDRLEERPAEQRGAPEYTRRSAAL